MAVAAIKGEKTLIELAQDFDVHPNQIKQWRDQLLEGATTHTWRKQRLLQSGWPRSANPNGWSMPNLPSAALRPCSPI